jgi:hypothetical protein
LVYVRNTFFAAPLWGDKIAWGDDTKVSELMENSRNGILCTPRVNPPRKRRISFGPDRSPTVKVFFALSRGRSGI